MFKQDLNFEIKAGKKSLGVTEDVATKIGSIFGEKGREIGRKIDEKTKGITIEHDVLSTEDK